MYITTDYNAGAIKKQERRKNEEYLAENIACILFISNSYSDVNQICVRKWLKFYRGYIRPPNELSP